MSLKDSQCKDISTYSILCSMHTGGHHTYSIFPDHENSIHKCFPKGTHPNLIKAKLRKLISRAYISSELRGCRGYFTIAPQGGLYFRDPEKFKERTQYDSIASFIIKNELRVCEE